MGMKNEIWNKNISNLIFLEDFFNSLIFNKLLNLMSKFMHAQRQIFFIFIFYYYIC